ncbi:MAG: ABC transporter substrate-binding protein [Bacillota bacterium]
MRVTFKAIIKLFFVGSIIVAFITGGLIVNGAAKPYAVNLTQKYKGQKIVVWQGLEETDVMFTVSNRKLMAKNRKTFEEATGVKIEVVKLQGETADQRKKTIAAILAGNGPDIFFFGIGDKIPYIQKKLIIPISKYINFSDKDFMAASDLSPVTHKFMTWGKKVYGIHGPEFSDRLYYNKELFEINGLEDPLKLYKAGKWNWDKFLELAKKLTQDTDGNGKVDQYGYQSWLSPQWFLTNNVRWVKYVGKKAVFNGETENVYYTLQFIYDIVFKHKISPRVWWEPSPQAQFYKGKVAMDYWGYWEMAEMKKQMGNKLGIVPFPAGPYLKNKKSADRYQLNVMGISACCKNPALAALFIKWLRVPSPAEKAQFEKEMIELYGSKEIWDLIQEMNRNAEVLDCDAYGRLADIVGTITYIENQTPAQAVQAIKKVAQSAIDEVVGQEMKEELKG